LFQTDYDFHCFKNSCERHPQSHTNGHEEKEKIFVPLRVTLWMSFIFIISALIAE
jgi:hypothetical protein